MGLTISLLLAAVARAPLPDAAFAQIAHRHGEQAGLVEPHLPRHDFDGKHLSRQGARVALSSRVVEGEQPGFGALAREHRDEFSERLIDEVVAGTVERARRGCVRRADDGAIVHAEQRILRAFQNAIDARVSTVDAKCRCDRTPDSRIERA